MKIMAKIAIAGAGAMGSRFGYMLQKAGNDVILMDNWEQHVETINEKGLTVDDNGQTQVIQIPAMAPRAVKEVQDLVILFTKTMQLKTMLEDIKGTIGKNTAVLCLMNGLGNVDVIEQYVKKQHIIVGVTLWTSELVGPGHISFTGSGSIGLQNIDPREQDRAAKVVSLLNAAGLNATLSTDVTTDIWKKACVNGTLNSLCTLLDCNIEEFGQLKEAPQMAREILNEFAAVAKLENVTIDVDEILTSLQKLGDTSQAGAHYPSMHQDLIQHHRKTEIDFLNGYVAKKGKANGIATPYNTLVTQLVHAKEQILVEDK
ncbi:panE protein [Lactobacillus selangorensis]|uniref:2-dehydropantoate 2-reductase n=2 Tax=Lactobacillus selangorensis TaxID=81857 RepID=A0A0R2FK98_9LACO|nr:panE protein [Lactobacillus selangorensis]KRN30032.1 panE protein [Lactobacillus selangorensis]